MLSRKMSILENAARNLSSYHDPCLPCYLATIGLKCVAEEFGVSGVVDHATVECEILSNKGQSPCSDLLGSQLLLSCFNGPVNLLAKPRAFNEF